MNELRFTLSKKERLCSKLQIERLFSQDKGNHSASAFPVRMIYRWESETENEGAPAAILISVPKRYFKHAVDRNHVKRQIREAYRKNKYILPQLDGSLESSDKGKLNIAFIWVDGKHRPTDEVEKKIIRLLNKVKEDDTLYK